MIPIIILLTLFFTKLINSTENHDSTDPSTILKIPPLMHHIASRDFMIQAGSPINKDDPDFSPLYICKSNEKPLRQDNWYQGCRSSCTFGHKRVLSRVVVYVENYTDIDTSVWKVNVYSQRIRSKESLFSSCYHDVVDSGPAIMEDSLKSSIRSHIATERRDQGIIIIGEKPPCNYFTDNYANVYKVVFNKEIWKLSADIDQNRFFINPKTSESVTYNDGELQEGNNWYFWEVKKEGSSECLYKQAFAEMCKVVGEYYYCKENGVTFSKEVSKHIDNTCIGPVTISKDGVVYSTTKETEVGSTVYDVTRLKDKIPDITIKGAISAVNDILTSLESTYCESICDIMENILAHGNNEGAVIETPIGPWITKAIRGISWMYPCHANMDYKIIMPLSICPESNLIKVRSLINGETQWWNPEKTFINSGELCPVGDNEHSRMDNTFSNHLPFIIRFWRGTYVVDYPYNSSGYWISKPDGGVKRSSKWFPKILQIDSQRTIVIKQLETEIHKHIKELHSSHLKQKLNESSILSSAGFSNKIYNIYHSTKDTLFTIYHKIHDFLNNVMHIISLLTMVAVTLLIAYFIKLVVSLFSGDRRRTGKYYVSERPRERSELIELS